MFGLGLIEIIIILFVIGIPLIGISAVLYFLIKRNKKT